MTPYPALRVPLAIALFQDPIIASVIKDITARQEHLQSKMDCSFVICVPLDHPLYRLGLGNVSVKRDTTAQRDTTMSQCPALHAPPAGLAHQSPPYAMIEHLLARKE